MSLQTFEASREARHVRAFSLLALAAMESKTVTTSYQSENYIHKDLWRAAVVSWERAEEQEKGSYFFHLSGLMMCACGAEAFANFLISVIDTEAFANERIVFYAHDEFHGTKGKFKWIAARAGRQLDSQIAGYNILCEVLAIRDAIAHGKPERREGSRVHSSDAEPPMMLQSELNRRVLILSQQDPLNRIESLCDSMQEWVLLSVPKGTVGRDRIMPGAFSGITGVSSRRTPGG